MCFVDFASAFNSVDRDSLWRIMAYYASAKKKVRVSGSDSTFLRSAPAFDKYVLSPLPSSVT